MKFKVRRYATSSNSWVVANDNNPNCPYYVQDNGSVAESPCTYQSLEEAEMALAVYHVKSNLPPSAEVKPTNPKQALGDGKAPLSTLPSGPMYEAALAMLEGARKYGRHNYRVLGVRGSTYFDAAIGHLVSWWEGEDIDSKSGIHHLGKAIGSLVVLRDSMMMGNWVDDRPPQYPDSSKLLRDHPAVREILEKYPDCVEPYTEANKSVDRTKPVPGGY